MGVPRQTYSMNLGTETSCNPPVATTKRLWRVFVEVILQYRVVRDRPVVGIHAVDLVLGFGTLHCLTQQQPVAGPRP